MEDAGCNNVAATNSILLSLLTDYVKNVHDIELPLCEHDTIRIVKLLCDRNSSTADYVLPPGLPTRFRCYVRMLSSSHLVLTVMPAVYDDMVALMSMLDSLAPVVESAVSDATKNVELVTEAVNCNRISADEELHASEDVEESSSSRHQVNGKVPVPVPPSVNAERGRTVKTDRPHSVHLPVFVFDCLLNLVSDQLVHHSITDRPADIVEDFTYLVGELYMQFL